MTPRLALLGVPAVLGACAGLAGGSGGGGGVALGPGARAEGRAVIAAGTPTTLRLTNDGPGRVDAVVRVAGGATMHDGPLTEAEVKFTPSARMSLVIVLETHPDEDATVSASLDAGGAAIKWDVSSGQVRR